LTGHYSCNTIFTNISVIKLNLHVININITEFITAYRPLKEYNYVKSHYKKRYVAGRTLVCIISYVLSYLLIIDGR